MVTLKFTHVHSSGRFDRPVSRQNRDIVAFKTQADLITLTEQSNNHAARAKGFAPGKNPTWEFYYPLNNDEFATLWDSTVFKLAGKPSNPTITKMTWTRSKEYGGRKAPLVRAFHTPLIHIPSNQRVDVLGVHMPLDNTALRANVWVDCCRGLRELTQRIRSNHPNTRILLTGDWNKNFRQADERAQMHRNLAQPLSLRQAWTNNVPKTGGTHGPRGLIDGDITDLQVRDCDLIKDTDASDHRPYRTILAFPAPKRTTKK